MRKTRVRKHRKDHNHARQGTIGGNDRYDRRHPEVAAGMGRNLRPRTPR